MFVRRRRRRDDMWQGERLIWGTLLIGVTAALAVVLLWGCEAHGQDFRAQEVNTSTSTACACALSGGAGACLTRDALRVVRDAAHIKLPSCEAQLAAKRDELLAVGGALAAVQAQVAVLGAANLDRKAAADLALKAAMPDAPSWWDRHGVGVAAALGVVVGAAVTIGIVYGVKPATVGTGAAKLNFSPLLRW